MALKISHALLEDTVRITARSGIVRLRTVPFSDWRKPATVPQRAAIETLSVWLDDETEGPDGRLLATLSENRCEICLAPFAVAALDEQTARILTLPPSTPLGLQLKTVGSLPDIHFHIDHAWIGSGRGSVRAIRQGAIIRTGQGAGRLPADLFGLISAAETLADPVKDRDERYRLYAQLQNALPADIRANIATDGYLSDVCVYHAAAFSLRVGVHRDDLYFAPVLFGREIQDAQAEGIPIHEGEDALLTPVLSDIFEERFMATSAARSAYPLQDGSFVIIDKALRPVLDIVHQTLEESREIKRRFLSKPRQFLRERLPEGAEAVVESLFIETEQFSDRVTGVDIWCQPVMAWIKTEPNSWIPEAFGVQIGDKRLQLTPEEAADALKKLQSAKRDGLETIEVGGTPLPVTEQAIDELEKLAALNEAVAAVQPAEQNSSSEAARTPPAHLADKLFLTVRENLEDVAYAPLFNRQKSLPDRDSIKPIAGLRSKLKRHQLDGLQWLVANKHLGVPGVLLADDMGLGKTLQALAFIACLRGAPSFERPVLIVAPTGLLRNWQQEMERHFLPGQFGDIVTAYGQGLQALRRHVGRGSDIATGEDQLNADEWARHCVLLTTYETMRDYHFSFARTRFAAIVFDEVQKLKNPKSQVTRAARSLHADFKIGMTGTPIENHLQDLWSIMDVLWPGLLGASKSFAKDYPVEDEQKLKALHAKLFRADTGMVPPALRRLKCDELDGLPEKIEHRQRVPMPLGQGARYMSILRRARALKNSLSPGDGMLSILHDLRMASLHPRSPLEAGDDLSAYAAESARFSKTLDILDTIRAAGEKVLIFLESREMQPILARLIRDRYGFEALPPRIHGDIKGPKRQEIVDQFQQQASGFAVLILSPKAGGVGLTLTAANHVIHLSRWWNPAIEDQSTDRVYRIGQTKPVHVYYPLAVHPLPDIAPSSFDIKLDALLTRKRILSNAMLIPPERRQQDARTLFEDITTIDETDVPQIYDQDVSAKSGPRQKQNSAAASETPIPPVSTPFSPSTHGADGVLGQKTFTEGTKPDFGWMFDRLNGWRVQHAYLEDPYCLSRDRNIDYTIKFFVELMRRCNGIENILIQFNDNKLDNKKTPQSVINYTKNALKKQTIDLGCQAEIFIYKRRPTYKKDFHDRYLTLKFSEKEKRSIQYSLSGGVDRLLAERFKCQITISEMANI
ncbi:DEAD/DEAH box helicase [Eilatimonas milleporae]|uniref:SNF2 family DNA or RNA helicase n=1 Tax=Eilatimonas milleporae TaxID=911205 RepID=A0A3M0CE32_9PROT|nr:DEAD/DEAH box helicase [Eilatimonas milleporae]RMB08084.1 SNF2 family DNA or RNA helicase [Eilatimonas milleporae]